MTTLELLETKDLVQNLENKGIKFNIVNKNDAIHFLENHNYYVKLASYRHNYDKDNQGQYIDLDFFHLKELSTIDMHLRFLILKTCLNVEHSIKVNLMTDIQSQQLDDVLLASNFLNHLTTKNMCIKDELLRRRNDLYIGNLLNKFSHPHYPIWVLVEAISFGNLIKLIDYYCKNYNPNFTDIDLLYRVRNFRNAAAHSNCLIHNLKDKSQYFIFGVFDYISKYSKSYKRSQIKIFFRNTFTHDFCSLMIALDLYVKSNEIKSNRINDFSAFLKGRVVRNKDLFVNNTHITETYKFIEDFLDIL